LPNKIKKLAQIKKKKLNQGLVLEHKDEAEQTSSHTHTNTHMYVTATERIFIESDKNKIKIN